MAISTLTSRDLQYIRLQLLYHKVVIPGVKQIIDKNQNLSPDKINQTLRKKKRHAESLRKRCIITEAQWCQLYPPDGGTRYVDVSVQILLLHYYGDLGEPKNFTIADLPKPDEVEQFHDIARVNVYVRKISSLNEGLSDEDFLKKWNGLTEALKRLTQNNALEEMMADILQKTPKAQLLTDFLAFVENEQVVGNASESYILDLKKKCVKDSEEKPKISVKDFCGAMSGQIGKDWKKIGIQLGFVLAKLEQFDINFPREVGKAIEEMLCTWWKENIKTQSTEECLQNLKKGLQESDRNDLAGICDIYEIDNAVEDMDESLTNSSNADRPDPDWLKDMQQVLKNKYECKYSELSFSIAHDTSKQFEVDSDLCKPVQYLPIEVSCKSYSTSSRGNSNKGKATHYNKASQSDMSQHSPSRMEEADDIEMDCPKTQTTDHITRLLIADSNPKPLLVEGEAGLGKTTLMHRLALIWANGSCEDLKQFDFVFLIHLRLVSSNNIHDIICEDLELLPVEDKMKLKRFLQLHSEKVLYLVDGLDEVALADNNELYQKLREPGNHVICTSRPVLHLEDNNSPYGMKQRHQIKLIGFSDDIINSYIKTYFHRDDDGGEDKAKKILDECRKHMFCKSIMSTPLYTGLICFLWEKHNFDLPDTATQLFNTFLREKLIIFWQKYRKNQPLHIDFERHPLENKMPNDLKRLLSCVADLAFKTLDVGKMVFSKQDISDSYLSMDDISKLGLFDSGDHDVIQFSHKLFHEYFAGLWIMKSGYHLITGLFMKSAKEILQRTHNFHHSFFFAAGMSTQAFGVMMSLIHDYLAEENSYTDEGEDSSEEDEGSEKEKSCEEEESSEGEESSEEDGEIERANEMECDAMKTCADAFRLQLIFENGVENESKADSFCLETIPVHCSSAHSLAATLNAMHAANITCNHLTLIGGCHNDTEQICCILDECKRATKFTTIALRESSRAVMAELHRLGKSPIQKIIFYDCEEVAHPLYLCSIFPKIQDIRYYGKGYRIYKRNNLHHGDIKHDKKFMISLYHQPDLLRDSETMYIEIQDNTKIEDILSGCKVHGMFVEDIHPLEQLHGYCSENQLLKELTINLDMEKSVFPCKIVSKLFPNLEKFEICGDFIKGFPSFQTEVNSTEKHFQVILSDDLNGLSQNLCGTHTFFAQVFFYQNIDNHVEFFRDMQLSTVSAFGLNCDYFLNRPDPWDSEDIHTGLTLKDLDEKRKSIKKYIKVPTAFSLLLECGIRHTLLGPFEITTQLCPAIEKLLKEKPLKGNGLYLEGAVINKLPGPTKMSIDEFFCVGVQWREWDNFKADCKDMDPKSKSDREKRNLKRGKEAVIRITKRVADVIEMAQDVPNQSTTRKSKRTTNNNELGNPSAATKKKKTG